MRKIINLIVLLALSCCLFFCACDSSTNKLRLNSIIDDDCLVLPFKPNKAYSGGNHIDFTSDMTLKEMENEIKSDNLLTEIYGTDFLLITKHITEDKIRYYLIIKNVNGRYVYMNPASNIYDDYFVLTPFHLFDASSGELISSSGIYEIYADIEYKINSTYDDFFNFYNAIEIYDIIKEETCMTISIKDDAYISDGYSRHTLGTFAIDFDEKEDGTYITYRIVD
ncbi:MAG: hypothetical protein WCR54_05520 [Clostridia bacterium]